MCQLLLYGEDEDKPRVETLKLLTFQYRGQGMRESSAVSSEYIVSQSRTRLLVKDGEEGTSL